MDYVRVVRHPYGRLYGVCRALCLLCVGMTQSTTGRRIPADSFRNRLAMVRTEMGWNYDQAEIATGVGSESWRLWERGLRRCTDVIGVSKKIADATGFDQSWLALGGPLAEETDLPTPPRARRAKAVDDASIRRVPKRSNRDWTRSTRRVPASLAAIPCERAA